LISNSHSIKISETAKGVRIDVHIYATDKQTAINEAISTYLETRLKAEKEKIQVAPMDVISK
jgi:ribosome-associated translation inhibitor RaiA